MRRLLPAVLVSFTAACASGGGSSDTAPVATPVVQTERIVTSSGGAGVAIQGMNLDNNVRLLSTGTVAQVWSVLPAVYGDLAIPLTVQDEPRKMIGNEGWRTRRQIGRVPMQRYLECGRSSGIENAETYTISMSIITTVSPNPSGGSVVATLVTATGRNPITSSTQEVRCSSTGDLEIRIRDMVQQRVIALGNAP
jgi:hypothetical protein